MNTALHTVNWQAWVAVGLGLMALAYLVRRWWPRSADASSAGVCGSRAPSRATACGGCKSCSGHSASMPRLREAPPHAEQVVQWHPLPPGRN